MADTFSFAESLRGDLHPNVAHKNLIELAPREYKKTLSSQALRLDLKVTFAKEDLYADAPVSGQISGEIQLNTQTFTIASGQFTLHAKAGEYSAADTLSELQYKIFYWDQEQIPYTLYGFKSLKQGDSLLLWKQTTMLHTALFEGHLNSESLATAVPLRLGLASMKLFDVLRIPLSFRSNSGQLRETLLASAQYMSRMAKGLAQTYLASHNSLSPSPRPQGPGKIQEFMTDDGYTLRLTRYEGSTDSKGAVLLLHGLTTSTAMFTMPEHVSLVSHLAAHGYGPIYSLDWRGSREFPYNLEPQDYSLDHVISHDIPKAISIIRQEIGTKTKLHAIGHCIGSLTMACSIAAGKATGLSSFVSNSVSLTPRVGEWSRIKLWVGPELLDHVLHVPTLSPNSYRERGLSKRKLLAKSISLLHPESASPACNTISFLWGQGYPAAYRLDNLHPKTYESLDQLFGGTGWQLYRHIRKMIGHAGAVPYSKAFRSEMNLPESYLQASLTHGLPPTLLLSGSDNRIFPGSNKKTYEVLKAAGHTNTLEYVQIDNYGHQDIFMGKAAHRDVFPHIIRFLDEQTG